MFGGFTEIVFAFDTFWILFNKLIIIIQNTITNILIFIHKSNDKKTNLMFQTEEYDPLSIYMNLSMNTPSDEHI